MLSNSFQRICILIFAVSILSIQSLTAQQSGFAGFKETQLTSKRSEILLNGIWMFQQAEDESLKSPNPSKWSKIQVPSSWIDHQTHQKKEYNRAWYEIAVQIPKNWSGKLNELELTKVSTDAMVYINDQEAGKVNWFSGKIDVSKYINYGQLNAIKILVISTPNEGEIPVLMGTATSQISYTKARLDSKGITGDILLSSKPKSAYVTDVFVQPSFRKSALALDVEITGIRKNGEATIQAQLFHQKTGQLERVFNTRAALIDKDTQLVKLSFQWDQPRLWDLDQPEMYDLRFKIIAKGMIDDEYLQSFGFREFWIEGKDFFLNGTKINLRPHLIETKGMHEIIDANLEINRRNGFNISEIWPNNFDRRGFLEHTEQLMDRADHKGYLLMGVALPFVDYIYDKNWNYTWDRKEVRSAYEQRLLTSLRRDRNHPSVVLWVTSGNFFGHHQDQNPYRIGMKDWVKDDPIFQRNANAGISAINIIKKHDPTRPVTTHHGTYVGDIHTLNFYLDLIPLQEREEWMSQYAKSGQIPFIGIEFGTPLYCTFLRGRNGFGENILSEPLVTEFAAMYLGNKSYQTETSDYRNLIKQNFIKDQRYHAMDNPPIVLENMPSFGEIQSLFTKNTWRSWRTYGVSGGMLPWVNGHGWTRSDSANNKIKMPPFNSGRRGIYTPEVSLADIKPFQAPAFKIQPSGYALIENNNETLAYIAGHKENFTNKAHHFKTGQLIEKQVILINDARVPQMFKWEYKVIVDNQLIESKSDSTFLAVSDLQKIPFSFKAPNITNFKVDGKIILSAYAGKYAHRDTFTFRVFKPSPNNSTPEIFVFDPVGKTSKMLTQLGYKTKKWLGNENFIPSILFIGREVLSKNYRLPFDLKNYVAKGSKVIIFNQQDSFMRKKGFRVAEFNSRYVFKVPSSSMFTSLDDEDLRNWSSASTLRNPYPDYLNSTYEMAPDQTPIYGWHWGNEGSVATHAIEKPHHSGWTPLLECEFDLAYSPLMELNYGKGKLIWCALDLEDQFSENPVAEIVTHDLIAYSAKKTEVIRNKITLFIGNDQEKRILDNIGLKYETSISLVKDADLIICGTINQIQQQVITDFVSKGGKVMILPREDLKSVFGVRYEKDDQFNGGGEIPMWSIAKGLSISDVRYKLPYPTVKIAGGCEIGINGLIGRKSIGKGSVYFCQIDPDRFHADSLTYFRYTRWRYTRAITQILANLGSSFLKDESIFEDVAEPISSIPLDKTTWKAQVTLKYPAANDVSEKIKDPGISQKAKQLVQKIADESEMVELQIPQINGDFITNQLNEFDGELVYRKSITIPENMLGKNLILNLSTIDDFDQVYFNGTLIGFTDENTKENWSYKRVYEIPSNLVTNGVNVIAIRVFDWYGGGGMNNTATKREITLDEKTFKKPLKLYHQDYRTDFELGDNPFRYFRW